MVGGTGLVVLDEEAGVVLPRSAVAVRLLSSIVAIERATPKLRVGDAFNSSRSQASSR